MTNASLDRASELAERRRRLQARCAAQRKQLAEHAKVIEQELAGIDRTVAMVKRFVSKPALVAASVAALTMIGPKRALRWVMQGTLWWGTAKRFFSVYQAMRGASTRLESR